MIKVSWQAPERGTLKINVDAAFLEQAGCGSIGHVVRDSECKLIRAQPCGIGLRQMLKLWSHMLFGMESN